MKSRKIQKKGIFEKTLINYPLNHILYLDQKLFSLKTHFYLQFLIAPQAIFFFLGSEFLIFLYKKSISV